MVTAETITDEQLLRLRDQAKAYGNQDLVYLCCDALGYSQWSRGGTKTPEEMHAARSRCAELINARKAGAQ